VLLEVADGAEAFARVRLLERHGYDAAWCPAPPEALGSRCPLVAGEGCPLTDWADVVVTSLGVDHPGGREVLEAVRRLRPELPVVVEATKHDLANWPQLLDGHRILTRPTTPPALLQAVEGVLGGPAPAASTA
jgi:CheY-like chemotaxis protein